jgi:hypothetical protein
MRRMKNRTYLKFSLENSSSSLLFTFAERSTVFSSKSTSRKLTIGRSTMVLGIIALNLVAGAREKSLK